jgi:hypothetical protein
MPKSLLQVRQYFPVFVPLEAGVRHNGARALRPIRGGPLRAKGSGLVQSTVQVPVQATTVI